MDHKLKVVLLAPIELLVCTMHGAWIGFRDGTRNVRDAWHYGWINARQLSDSRQRMKDAS